MKTYISFILIFFLLNSLNAQDTLAVDVTWTPVKKKVVEPVKEPIKESLESTKEDKIEVKDSNTTPAIPLTPCKTFMDGLYHMKNTNNRNIYWYIKNDVVVEKDIVSKTEYLSNLIWVDECEFVLKYTKLSGTTTKNLGDKVFYSIDKVNGNEYTLVTAFRGIEIKEVLVKEE
jgi:hypothetical protein